MGLLAIRAACGDRGESAQGVFRLWPGSDSLWPASVSRAGLALILVLLGWGITGCKSSTAPQSASEVLDRMAAAYREAEAYSDQGVGRLKIETSAHSSDETFPYAVTFRRPDKLLLNNYDGQVGIDGEYLRAYLKSFPEQALEVAAPQQLTVEAVYREELLVEKLAGGLAGASIQLVLLLTDTPLENLLAGQEAVELLDNAAIDGAECYRVQARSEHGRLVFWIDKDEYLLRRVEYPVEGLRRSYAQQTDMKEVSLVVDLHKASFTAPTNAAAYRVEVPQSARLVEYFDVIPRPDPLSHLLGKQVGPFRFTRPDGTLLDSQELAGRVAVIDFWTTGHDLCWDNLAKMQQLAERYRNDERVVFLPVNVDHAPGLGNPIPGQRSVSNEELRAGFAKRGFTLPTVRDTQLAAHEVFGVTHTPNLFILGPDGTVQDSAIGTVPELLDQLPARIDALLAGKAIYPDALKRYEEHLRAYQAQFPADPAIAAVAPTAPTNFPAASEPTKLQLRQLWQNAELASPRALVVYAASETSPTSEAGPTDSQWRVAVVDETTKLVELSLAGQILARHEPQLPAEQASQAATSSETPDQETAPGQAAGTQDAASPESAQVPGRILHLHTAVDASGARYFVGWWPGQQQLHLFDANFKYLLSYPDAVSVGGVSSVQLVDLNADGTLELVVGYYDVVGIQAVRLDGESRLWWNRSLSDIIQMALWTPAPGQPPLLLVTHKQGTLGRIDHQGKSLPPLTMSSGFLYRVFAEPLSADAVPAVAGLSRSPSGEDTFVGINAQGQVSWLYPGVGFRPSEELVVSAKLLPGDKRQWLLATADGAVHLVGDDGQPLDKFFTGGPIMGMAVASIEERPVLLISSPSGVTAWEVTPRP